MPHILVADDEPAIRDLIAMALHPGWARRISCAADGREALAILKSQRPALVISDTQMPLMDGVRLARRVIAHGIPFVLMTADPVLQKSLRDLHWPYLAKPFRLAELQPAVSETLVKAQVNLRQVGNALARLCLVDNREAADMRAYLRERRFATRRSLPLGSRRPPGRWG